MHVTYQLKEISDGEGKGGVCKSCGRTIRVSAIIIFTIRHAQRYAGGLVEPDKMNTHPIIHHPKKTQTKTLSAKFSSINQEGKK